MTGERTVPLLPCADIDEVAAFYSALGFTTTYRQQRPNPYVTLHRDDLHLHFFGIPGFEAEQSYGTCLVLVADTAAMYDAFAAGMRATYGKVLVTGIPRITHPRRRKNADFVSGFSVVDPGGNWIRFTRAEGSDDVTDSPSDEAVTGTEPTSTEPTEPDRPTPRAHCAAPWTTPSSRGTPGERPRRRRRSWTAPWIGTGPGPTPANLSKR